VLSLALGKYFFLIYDHESIVEHGPRDLASQHHEALARGTTDIAGDLCPDDDAWTSLLLVAVVLRARPALKNILRFSPPHKCRAAVCLAAVRWADVDILQLLLSHDRIPANRGWPLREATRLGRRDAVEALLQCPRIDPNRGTPLYYAVVAGDLEILRMLLGHPRIRINRCTMGVGSTALCEAVMQQRYDMVDVLVRHPGANVNKGYLLSPLQLAVASGNPRMVGCVVVFPEVKSDLVSGESLSPLRYALSRGDVQVFKELLRYDKVSVTDDVVDAMEEGGGWVEFQQAVIESGRPLLLGRTWRRRMAFTTFGLLLTLLLSVAEISLAYFYLEIALQVTFGVLTLLVPLIISPLLQLGYNRYKQGTTAYPSHCMAYLEYFPVFPAYHMMLFYRTVNKLFDDQDVYGRERCYVQLSQRTKLHASLHAAPQLLLQIVVLLLRLPDPGGGELIYAIGRVPYEAESVPWNYVMAVIVACLCILFGSITNWMGW